MEKFSTILLVVDAQEGFRNIHTERAIPFIVTAVRSNRYPVLFTRFINDPDSNFERVLNWPKMRSDANTAMLRELSSFVSSARVFDKSGYSAFTSLQFSQYIRDAGVESMDICGFDTDACVLATALNAFDAGYRPRILAEACASSGGMRLHESGLEILERNVGKEAIIRGRTNA